MKTNSALTLRILSPEGMIFERSDLQSVSVPLIDGGTIGIRPAHAPLIAETVQGEVGFQTHGSRESVQLYAGVLDIYDNIVTILTAGEVSEDIVETGSTPQLEYDRLMKTLINHIYPEQEQAGQV